MAKPKEGVYENLLKYASLEFLKNGFTNASLRKIAEAAGTTTGSIYSRFKDKSGLYHEIIDPAKQKLLDFFQSELANFEKGLPHISVEKMFTYTAAKQHELVDLLYDNYTAFKLLVCCSEGNEFADFTKKIGSIDASYTLHYIESIHNDAVSSGRLTPAMLDLISTTYWMGLFKIFENEMSRTDAYVYATQLKRFFRCGWRDIFTASTETTDLMNESDE